MIWAVVIIGGILVFAAISSASKKTEEAQKNAEFNTLLKTRVDAYQDYLRRTASSAEIKAMTDNELREYLQNNIRSFNKEKKSEMSGAGFIGAAIVFVGMMLAAGQQKWEPLILLGIVGAGVTMFIIWKTEKKRTEKYRAKGFDPERLTIEQ
jgi:preprotein translocase subunit YajC